MLEIEEIKSQRLKIKKELFKRCHCAESNGFCFSWGALLGAVSYDGIYATLISKQPRIFLGTPNNEANWFQVDIGEMNMNINALINMATNHKRIQLIAWEEASQNNKVNLLVHILDNKMGVLIPTLKWGVENHSIVLTSIKDGIVTFNNPNHPTYQSDLEYQLSLTDFRSRWFHNDTDDDLIIISDAPIDFLKIMQSTK